MQSGGAGKGKEEEDENPKPFNKLRYKMAKLNYQQQDDADEDEEKVPPLTSPDVVAIATPTLLNGSFANPSPSMKKLKIPAAAPDSPSPSSSVVNFGPFAPSGSSSNNSILRIRVIGPKQPPPQPEPVRRLLAPHKTTYLRPRPAIRQPVSALDPDPNTRMGPPASRICKTPYQTVKEALTFLKSELRLTAFHPTETTPPHSTTSDSLSKISPDSAMSIEEVILELDEYVSSIPKTASSDEMKELLMAFQRRLGMPEWPGFYNLMWVSAMEFVEHLGDYFVFDSIDEEDQDEDMA